MTTTTEVLYDEAEAFQAYSPALQSLSSQIEQEVYSNSAELNLAEYSNSEGGDCVRFSGTSEQSDATTELEQQDDNVSNNCSSTSGDAASAREDDVIDQSPPDAAAEQKEEGSSAETSSAPQHEVPWNLKLRNNWKRHLRRKAAANDQKSKKSSDNQYNIGGSLSRSVVSSRAIPFRSGIADEKNLNYIINTIVRPRGQQN